ncbi:MAG: Crp/Fnr family transcriptional regulator [Burkholderiales bacterium]|nr:Crp/Fnr family transcriptional regulator [Burkholderiales bacterium]
MSGRDNSIGRDLSAMWCALFGCPALTPGELDLLSNLSQLHTVTHGASVLDRARNAHTLVALQDGEVAVGFRTADGTFRTERIVRGPAWLDLSSAWLDDTHAMDAIASTLSTVVELPRDALQAQLQHHPELAQRLIRSLALEVQALAVNTHELMHKDAPARLAQWLRQRCEPQAGASGRAVVHLHERKRDVASQLAITPETLSRLMRSFTTQGVIEVAGYTVRVLDLTALERLATA